MKIGVTVFGAASAAAGVLDLIWGEFEPAHQPLHAWGDHIPGATAFAYIAALWLIAGGMAVLWEPSRRLGAAALTFLDGIFVLFPLPRFVTAPQVLGYRAAVYIGVVGNVCEQFVLFVAAAILWRTLTQPGLQSRRAVVAARCAFAFCPLFFGLGNLTALDTVTPMIPRWLPPGAMFWAAFTGVAFVLAGLAILSGVLDVLAAWLLGAMMLSFNVLVLAPLIVKAPRDHVSWGANAFNLTVAGAAWIVAEWLGDRRRPLPAGIQGAV
jgi:uncharacterized membrane protein YphA (DoxX/SURF4 family)